MKIYRKYKKNIILVLLLLVIFMMVLVAYDTTPICKVHKYLNEIDENTDEIVLEQRAEGQEVNPYACFEETAAYKELISMGMDALPVLCNNLRTSRDSGFKEYVMCIAIEEITGTNIQSIPEFAWDNPRQFHESWERYLKEVPDRICAILDSEVSPEKKAWELRSFGLLAVPVLDRRMMDGNLDEDMKMYLEDLVKETLKNEKLKMDLSADELHKVICKKFNNIQKCIYAHEKL